MPTGVSVVIPSYRGAAAAAVTIESLDAQTLAPERFEAILVVNGPAADDLESFDALRARFPRITVRILATSTAGASLAWNLGVQAARMEWLTFLDDDDTVTPTFLAALLDLAAPGVVPLAPIHDVHADGAVDTSTPLNDRIAARAGTTVSAAVFPQALGFNASKLIPTRWAKASRYDRRMTNGQDVAFFGDISMWHDITFSVVAEESGAAYRRGVSGPSMSRQVASFEFSIEQRLDVIERIDRSRRRSRRRAAADHLIRAQVHLMNRYLVEHPERRRDAVAAIECRRFGWFPYPELNRDLATRVVFVADGETTDRLTRDRFTGRLAHWNEPVDVVAIAGQAPTLSWTRDVWWDRQVAPLEGRLIQVKPPIARAAVRVAAAIGDRPAYRELVSISRPHGPHGLAEAVAGRCAGLCWSSIRPRLLGGRA